ncbi:Beta-lactamase [Streptomyces sp. MnatMP-M27]|nr:Beta-lactamase [Streptomyces sp. MnatMP-M27]
MTLEQVLLHTCGFPNATFSDGAVLTRERRTAQIAEWPLEWEPGSRYEYHGFSAHWVLAEVIERVTGQDYRTALRSHVLDPLALDRIELGVPRGQQGDLKRVVPIGHHNVKVLKELVGQPVDVAVLDANEQAVLAVANDPDLIELGVPGANAFSDAASVALFYQELLWNSSEVWRPDVLKDATGSVRNTFPEVARMCAPANRTIGLRVTDADAGPLLEVPSLNTSVRLRPFGPNVSKRAFGHGGAGGQSAWADPETGLSFCLLVNGMDRDGLADRHRHDAIESLAAQCA